MAASSTLAAACRRGRNLSVGMSRVTGCCSRPPAPTRTPSASSSAHRQRRDELTDDSVNCTQANECMFDSGVELPAVGAAQLAGLIEQNHAELKAAECRMLQLACAWADAHYLDSGSQDYQPLIQRACAWGGEGTPEISEYCAAELGALQGTGMMAARALIADALDLRYRLPGCGIGY